jgi:hypothetical protein
MRVRIISFGTNWWAMHSRDLDDPFCFRRSAAWFNSAGLKYGRRLRLCWVYPGQIRFNLNSGFQPEHPLRSIGRTFLCSGPNHLGGRTHLLFVRLSSESAPDRYLVTMNDASNVHVSSLEICRCSADIGQPPGSPVRSNASHGTARLGGNRRWPVVNIRGR